MAEAERFELAAVNLSIAEPVIANQDALSEEARDHGLINETIKLLQDGQRQEGGDTDDVRAAIAKLISLRGE